MSVEKFIKVKSLVNRGWLERNKIYTVFREGKLFYEIFLYNSCVNDFGHGTVSYPKRYFTKERKPGETW